MAQQQTPFTTALLLAIRRHNFSHPEFESLLHCIAGKAQDMTATCTEQMVTVHEHLCDAAVGMDDVHLACVDSMVEAMEWRFEDQRTEAV